METKIYLVEKQKIAANIRALGDRVGSRKIYAALKANAYGLGAVEMARVCGENGLTNFAVTDVKTAKAVLEAGIPVEEVLLMVSADPSEIPELAQLGITFTVASEQDAINLSEYAVRAHIKVDTGMGRRGFLAQDAEKIASLYTSYPNIQFTGIYTHFANGGDRKATRLQFDRFRAVLDTLRKAGIEPGLRHCCASTTVFGDAVLLLDGVRIGSALLGRVTGMAGNQKLARTGMCQVTVEAVRSLPKGATAGYGGVYRAPRDMQVAVCAIGTHNGVGVAPQVGVQAPITGLKNLLRLIRNRLSGHTVPTALIGGKRCKVVGTVYSETVMLDVTDVPCQPGDTALFDVNPILLHDVPVKFI